MKCQRCLNGEVARYRVYTDAIDIKVCGLCAEEARELGITVEVLDSRVKRKCESKRSGKDTSMLQQGEAESSKPYLSYPLNSTRN